MIEYYIWKDAIEQLEICQVKKKWNNLRQKQGFVLSIKQALFLTYSEWLQHDMKSNWTLFEITNEVAEKENVICNCLVSFNVHAHFGGEAILQ